MKLADIIKKFRVIYPEFEVFTPEILRAVKDDLQACDEFKDCKITVVDHPISQVYKLYTYKVRDNTRFSGEVFLFNIALSPVMYNLSKVYSPVKDNCSISPVVYYPEDFTPLRRIDLY